MRELAPSILMNQCSFCKRLSHAANEFRQRQFPFHSFQFQRPENLRPALNFQQK